MSAQVQGVLCRYHYDALDRLIGATPTNDAGLRRFYCKNRLATEIQDVVLRSFFLQGNQLLAQQNRQGDLLRTALLSTDQMRSVLQVVEVNQPHFIAYSPYGYRPAGSGLRSLLGFNGEQPDMFTGHYLLGNGYRAFNPVLMRFNSPDNMSPFGKGGLNPYSYCSGDPVNRYDDSGHIPKFISHFLELFRRKSTRLTSKTNQASTISSHASSTESLRRTSTQVFGNLSPHAQKPEEYLRHYNEIIKHGPPEFPIKIISSADDLLPLGNVSSSVNFVFSDRRQLVIGDRTTHPTLSAFAGSSKVITAGYIRKGPENYVVTNASGHYQPSFESLYQVRDYMAGLGVQVELVKHVPYVVKH